MYMIYLFFSSTTWIYYFKLDKVLICYLPDILTTEKMKESTGASKAPPESSSHNNHSGSTIEIIFAERKTLGFSIVAWGVLFETTNPCSLILGIFGHVGYIIWWASNCSLTCLEAAKTVFFQPWSNLTLSAWWWYRVISFVHVFL